MKYEYSEVVKQVNSLNSISTLKKWRKKAEELAGVSFYENIVKTGRKSSVRLFLFSEEDVQKFQQVADTKAEFGLDNAIIRAFANERGSPRPLNERIELLEFILMDLEQKVNTKINSVYHENRILKVLVNDFEKRIVQLEEQPKRKKLFGRKN